MRRRRFSPSRFQRVGGRNHVTKPRVEGLEERWLLSGDEGLAQAYGQLPLSFEANQGQTDPQVDFLSRGSGYALFLTPTEAVLSLQAPALSGATPDQAGPNAVLSMQLVGASATPQVVGQDQLPGVSNYLIGNDPSQWHTDIPNYAQVEEQSVYPGVDLVYYGNQQQLEYNFTVAPGANPGVIRMAFTGAQSATLDAQGNLVLQTAGGPVVEQAPVLYQESGGVRQAVSGQYVLEGNGQIGFAVGSYDPSLPLVIDPILSYSTYLGGSGGDEGVGIAVDSAGNAYVTGTTYSTNFPTANPLQSSLGSSAGNAFVSKLNPAGSALVYSTYLGGSGGDQGVGIAVDSAGNAYVTGYTASTNFPTAKTAVPLVSGSATSGATTSLAVAAHTIKAIYSSDGNFTASTGTLTQMVNPGPATQLVVMVQPPTSVVAGTAFSLTVEAEDAGHNLASSFIGSGTVSLASNPTSATLGGSVTATFTNGIATFPGLRIVTAGAGYTLIVAASGLTPATTGSITVTPGAASQLVVAQQPSAVATAGVAFATQPVVIEEDQYGNVITSDTTHTVTAARSTGTSSLQGSNLTVTLSSGVATFSGLSFGLTVTAEDGAGHMATAFNGPVTVALVSDPGGASLFGTLTATAMSGVATFSGLALNKAGTGYTLQLTGDGMSATTGAIATLQTTTPASHQIYSTVEKQLFLDLGTTYAQRAARLTAIATTIPAPLNIPIDELAAYYWDQSQTDLAIANDPPDGDFTTVAPPQDATVPPLSAGGAITQAEADTFNALFAEQAQALGLAQAISTALDSAQAAAANPADATYAQMQLAAVTQFSNQLGTVAASEPDLEANVQMALQAGGVADVSVSPSAIQALQGMTASAGLPAGLVGALQQLATGDSQLQDIQLQDIQANLVAQDAAMAAGSLAATLTDPAFATQVQNAAQTLMATVLLSGGLTPASDTGVSHDGLTNDATPTFAGTAPSGTTVELFAQSQVDSTPVLIGTAVADPGSWQITATHLNDGTYAISARFSGGASGFGQVTPLTQVVIETVAPQITAAAYNHKTGRVTITFSAPAGIDPASLANPAFFVARTGKGATSPALKITGSQGAGTQVSFTVTKGRSHPSTIYLEVVSGGVQDLAGNALDGAFNGTLPSGDGHPGGDFFAPLPIPIHKSKKPPKAPHKSKA